MEAVGTQATTTSIDDRRALTGLSRQISYLATSALTPHPNSARKHSRKQSRLAIGVNALAELDRKIEADGAAQQKQSRPAVYIRRRGSARPLQRIRSGYQRAL
jgi:hypothetical protein